MEWRKHLAKPPRALKLREKICMEDRSWVFDVHLLHNILWVGTSEGLYSYDDKQSELPLLRKDRFYVNSICSCGDNLYILGRSKDESTSISLVKYCVTRYPLVEELWQKPLLISFFARMTCVGNKIVVTAFRGGDIKVYDEDGVEKKRIIFLTSGFQPHYPVCPSLGNNDVVLVGVWNRVIRCNLGSSQGLRDEIFECETMCNINEMCADRKTGRIYVAPYGLYKIYILSPIGKTQLSGLHEWWTSWLPFSNGMRKMNEF